jgi:Ca2+-transporting ATPase
MRGKPRRPDDRLFDGAVLVRGLAQGIGLLALLCGVYVWSRRAAHADDVARALTFTVLVLSNIGLIYVNRSWDAPPWQAGRAPNRYFDWMAAATVVLLAAVLAIPDVARLFAFALPPARMLAVAGACSVLATLWFEGVKAILRTHDARP